MTGRTEKQKMLAGELYVAADPELEALRRRAKVLCAKYNRQLDPLDRATLEAILGYATDACFEPPFFCDYGENLRLGRRVYANHNFVVLDCALVTIGDDVMIGPNVTSIGNRVWLGAQVCILPGVEIGEDTTIGAGSVVTRSIPPGSVAFGNPCRVIRSIEAPS
jgi:maltose O-acetyltransferase